jgi:hypothetical protein
MRRWEGWCRISREHSIGVRVRATNAEIVTVSATVRPNWRKKRPMTPLMNATGRKTATIDEVAAITANPTSAVPRLAA